MKKRPSGKEIAKMSYENRMARYKQEEQEVITNAKGKTVAEVSDELKELVKIWKV